MSVYTRLSHDTVADWLSDRYGLALAALRETTDGIENSNFFVDIRDADGAVSRRVLTLFESVDDAELPWFAALLHHLGAAGLPVPAPYPDRYGKTIGQLAGKACMLVPCLPGSHIRTPGVQQCRTAGAMLARMHLATTGFGPALTNPFGDAGRSALIPQLEGRIAAEDLALIRWLNDRWREREQASALPRGIVHGDLFHDNALFSGPTLTGVIDFYHACEDTWLYDLAIMLNDWCREPGRDVERRKHTALLEGYESVRPLTADERRLLPEWQVYAALRFWLSRLKRKHADDSGRNSPKSPDDMRALLLQCLARCPSLTA